MTGHVASSGDAEFDVRRYRPADRTAVRSLYERVSGGDGSAWLSWKYEDNPYLDHVPMTVASADGTLVAAAPALAFELHAGTRQLLALQPTDLLVHPDYRQTGIAATTIRHLETVYADRDPALFFTVGAAGPTRSEEWQAVATLETAYRLHRPQALLADDAGRRLELLAHTLGPLMRLSHRIRDTTPPEGTVTHSNHVPARTLTGLAREHRPTGIHAVRNPRYLAWRFENPEWSYTTYLTGETEARAAIVVGERRLDGTHVVALTDVYPPAVEHRADAVERLVRAVVADHPHADRLVAAGSVLPRRLRRRTGFRCDHARPLSWLVSPATLYARPATAPTPAATDWELGGLDASDPSNWHLSLAERDGW